MFVSFAELSIKLSLRGIMKIGDMNYSSSATEN